MSTYFGGAYSDYGKGITIDSNNNIYITGRTSSNDFPVKNAFNTTYGGNIDAFVAKFNSNGNLNFSTYFGGNLMDEGNSIAVDKFGNCYITGDTASSDFPIKNAFNATYGGNIDSFVAKFNPNGGLIFSTFIGGNSADIGTDIAVDNEGNSYITGFTASPNFPVKMAYNETYGGKTDCFLTKLNATGAIVTSTYVGGSGEDEGLSLALDSGNIIYVAGFTTIETGLPSPTPHPKKNNFPIKNAYNDTYGGNGDIFISKFDQTGKLLYSTYFGGSEFDEARSIAIDKSDNIYITGITNSRNFPIKNAYNGTYGGNGDVFVTKFDSNQKIIFSTFIGGSDFDQGNGIALDNFGNCFITGQTFSQTLPNYTTINTNNTNNINNINNTNNPFFGNVFIAKLGSLGTMDYQTYLVNNSNGYGNDIVIDSSGNGYIIGYTYSSNFILKNATDNQYNGNGDIFITKFSIKSVSESSKSEFFPIIAVLNNYLKNHIIILISISTIILITGLYTIIEYRQYSIIKKKLRIKKALSFKKFMLQKLKSRNKNDKIQNRLSEETLDLIQEIEDEAKESK